MATRAFNNVIIRGISAAVPCNIKSNSDIYSKLGDVAKTAKTVGVSQRHVADENTCTSDLCFQAADKLLNELAWDRKSVDALVFLSQTPDYLLPATSCVLQYRLGLSTNCAAFDMSLGCSGYIYGLLTAFGLIDKSGIKRILLLVGDTISKVLSSEDMPANVLFGDAGTATAIEFSAGAPTSYFVTGTDGSGAESLIIQAGRFRKPSNASTKIRKPHVKDKVIRSEEELFMDGSAVFSFTLSKVPECVNELLSFSEKKIEQVDTWLFHQANKFMLDYLGNKIGISPADMPMNMSEFGNTSPPSIPLLAVTEGRDFGFDRSKKMVGLVGFGVGLSWGGALINIDNIVIPDLILINQKGI